MLVFVVALGAGALIAAGCGDDDEATTEALSNAAFIAKASAILQQGDRELDQKGREYFKNASASEQEFARTAVIPTLEDEIDQISALPAPEGDEDQVNAIIDAAQDTIAQIEQDAEQITDVTKFRQAVNQDFAKLDQVAREYGLNTGGGG